MARKQVAFGTDCPYCLFWGGLGNSGDHLINISKYLPTRIKANILSLRGKYFKLCVKPFETFILTIQRYFHFSLARSCTEGAQGLFQSPTIRSKHLVSQSHPTPAPGLHCREEGVGQQWVALLALPTLRGLPLPPAPVTCRGDPPSRSRVRAHHCC